LVDLNDWLIYTDEDELEQLLIDDRMHSQMVMMNVFTKDT